MSSSLNSISGLFKRSVVSTCLVLVGMGATLVSMPAAAEVKVGVSDWPGWVAWYVAEQKGFFKKHGADVKLVWFDTEKFIREQLTEAAKIMAKVVNMTPEEYAVFLPGTKFFDASANTLAFDAKQALSLSGTAPVIAAFMTEHKLIEGKPVAAKGIDGSLLQNALK